MFISLTVVQQYVYQITPKIISCEFDLSCLMTFEFLRIMLYTIHGMLKGMLNYTNGPIKSLKYMIKKSEKSICLCSHG